MVKKIRGFDNYYISDKGEVINDKFHPTRNKFSRFKKLKLSKDVKGYLVVNLYKNGKAHKKYVHRLVLETFVGKCPDGMESCHNDGNRKNNDISNLRWDTHGNNIRDRAKHGTDNSGIRHPAYGKTLSESHRYKVSQGLKKAYAEGRR